MHALVDGPRTDVVDATRFWLDRFGSPWRIVDAGQRETLVTRGDPRFPALATRADGPVGADGGRHTVTAEYDARGNLKSQTDWGTTRVAGGATLRATTTYERADMAWPDFVTRVTLPEGEVTRMGYRATGNLEWQQPGDDATRAARFWYNAAGLADSVVLPVMNGQRAVERFTYDGALNLSAVTTPRGARTAFHNDSLGRTWKTESPIDGTNVVRQENTFYPGNDRVEYSRTIAPPLPGVNGANADTVIVLNRYDEEGNPKSVARRSGPDYAGIGWVTTRWSYDAAGRPVAEWAPDATPADTTNNPVDSTFYDKAGNVVRVRSRRYAAVGDDVTATYDALNRPLMRITPQVRYSAFNQGIAAYGFIKPYEPEAGDPPYPWYQDAGGGYLVRADTARFGYDRAGNLVQADNRDALIRRSYHVNGLLRGDTLRIRTQAELAEGGSFERHVYGLEHTYDLNGRISELRHPENIAPRMNNGVVHDRVRYAYDPLTGALASVTDPIGNRFSYQYDVRGQLDAAFLPGGIREDFDYDADGNVSLHQVYNGSVSPQRYSFTWLRQSVFEYDLRGKVRFAGSLTGTADTLRSTYSGLGHVLSGHTVSRTRDNVGNSVTARMGEVLTHDALGNLLKNETTSSVPTVDMRGYKDYLYEHGTARLDTANLGRGRIQLYSYDRAGNTIFSTTQIRLVRDGLPLRDQASYYGADGKLRATDTRTVENDANEFSPYTRVFEEYRYDALGRRVWVRARRNCKTGRNFEGECRLSKVRRTVWDGDRELYEIQMPDMALYAEEDTVQVRMGMYGQGAWPYTIDPNPFFGRVAYAYAGGVDRPLSITRMGYGDIQDDSVNQVPHRTLEPLAVSPVWNERGQPYIGVFADGAASKCIVESSTSESRCVKLAWPASWFAYSRPDYRATSWNGTLLEDKQDDSGVHYRRNRYYDPTTGRFTQEDPIGLAGGLNVYGFGNGDPVTYADPYGLSAQDCCKWAQDRWRAWNDWLDAYEQRQVDRFVRRTGASEEVARFGLDLALGMALMTSGSPTSGGGSILKGKLPDAIPRNLIEQIALSAARAGDDAQVIMRNLGDEPRLVANYGAGAWVKMQYVLRGPNGRAQSTVHWFRNVDSGMNVEFKFK